MLAVKLILVHNHPSGNLTPSDADKDITEEMIQAARLLHKEVLDHIIISTDDFYSFAESGLFAELEKSERFVPPYLLKEKARKEGEKNKAINIAKNMLSGGMNIDNVIELTGLSKTEVKDLLKAIKSEVDKG